MIKSEKSIEPFLLNKINALLNCFFEFDKNKNILKQKKASILL